MPLAHTQIDDFVLQQQNSAKRGKWVDVSLNYQEYLSAELLARKKADVWAGGGEHEFPIQISNDNNARVSGLYDEDQTSVSNLTAKGKIALTKITTNYTYDVDEAVFQGGPEEILDLLEVKQHSMENGFFELLESMLWTAPSSSAQAPMPLFGIPFWLQAASSTTGGFNGLNPSGFSSGAANISSSIVPKWANWNCKYTAIDRSDLIRKWREASYRTYFKAPASFNELGKSMNGNGYGYYTRYDVLGILEELLENRNDNLGPDVAKYMNAVMFRGTPVRAVPYLDENDTTNSVYGVNWNTVKVVYGRGRHRSRSAPIVGANKHSVRTVHEDTWMQLYCFNRRSNFVLNQ